MSTELMIPAGFAAPSTKLAASTVNAADLGAGITSSFAVVSYKGKVWSIKHRGIPTVMMRSDGTGPQNSIECVIVKSAAVISKIFYANGFKDGDNSPPDCWSVNGHSPDPAASAKQSPTCAGCPKNAWGSRISESGKAGKACSDSKRIAIVPSGDMRNEMFGGPMLLRIPAASLGGLSQYCSALQAMGHAFFGVVTEISFDFKEAFPLLTFKAKRVLKDEEVDILLDLQRSELTNRILNEAVDQVRAEVAQPSAPPASVAGLAGMAPAAGLTVVPIAVPVAAPVQTAPVVAPAANGQVRANPFAQPGAAAPMVDPPVVQVVAQTPTPTPPTPSTELTLEQKLAAAEAKLAELSKSKTTRKRTPSPSPAPTTIDGTAVTVTATSDVTQMMVSPVPPQVTTAPMQTMVSPQAITDLEAQLDALTGV